MEALKIVRPELLSLGSQEIQVLMPYFCVFGGAILGILMSTVRFIQPKWPVFLITLAACFCGIGFSYHLMSQGHLSLFNGMMVSDTYSSFFNVIFLASAAVTVLGSLRYLDREKLQHPEFYILVLFSVLGMMLMASSLDLIVLFIALELMSLAIYVLVGFRRADRRSNEAAIKYFILGSAASAVLLYGIALLYGVTGNTDIRSIFGFVRTHSGSLSPVLILGELLVLFGFLFKVAAVPFHMWMPDVYEGAPLNVTGFMTSGLKAAAFAGFVRVIIALGYGNSAAVYLEQHFHNILWISAVLTLLVGNFVALTQTNLKRMLAYSSIAHTGYLLIGIIAGPKSELGFSPIVMYVANYAIMNLGAFGILAIMASRLDSGLNLHDFSGIARRQPWLAFSMAVFLFSMAGIPPTAGFVSKYLLFYSAIQANEIVLVLIGVLSSAVSVYYYLRVIVYMYMRDPVGSPPSMKVSLWSGIGVAAMVALTLQLGVFPGRMVDFAKKAVTGLTFDRL